MFALIDKKCMHCKSIEEILIDYPQILKFYVEDGFVLINDHDKQPLDERILALPALISEKNVYIGTDLILEFIQTLNMENI